MKYKHSVCTQVNGNLFYNTISSCFGNWIASLAAEVWGLFGYSSTNAKTDHHDIDQSSVKHQKSNIPKNRHIHHIFKYSFD